MIINTIEIKLLRSDVDNFFEAMEFLVGPAVVKDGCLRSEVFYSKKERTTLIIYEQWETLQDYQKNIQSDLFKQIISLCELSVEKPKIRVFESVAVSGWSVIEKYLPEEVLKPTEFNL